MITVYLCCEGVTDYAVIPILMKKVKVLSDIDIQWVKRDFLKKFRTHSKTDIVISGHYKNVKALAAYSLKNDNKYIAYHQDADGRYNDVYETIKTEFKFLMEKMDFHCLAIVPKEMLESWLLADVKAVNSVGNGIDHVDQSPLPETLWGNEDDPNSDYPKNYLKRNLNELNVGSSPDTYAQIAEKTDIEVLKRRCPKSFGQFYADMQSFIGEENTP